MTERLLDARQVGELLGVSAKSVLRLAAAGELPVVRIGRQYRFRPSSLEEWLQQAEAAGVGNGKARRQPGQSAARRRPHTEGGLFDAS
jgi:excisionase family DNA binding protein